ncbi:MAG: fumarylacetoacetate hydrolase family protein, partial [Chitinophagaceae bacterium]
MKLFRWKDESSVKPGLIIEDVWYDASEFGEDYNEIFFETGGLQRLQTFAEAKRDLRRLDSDVKLAPPVARPSKIICIGLNYSDHAAETGAAIPQEPIVFFKSTSSIVGPNDNLVLPKGSEKTDWEVELAVVISKK